MHANPSLIKCPRHTTPIFHPDLFTDLVKDVARKIEQIREKHPEIEALAVTGHSGLPLGGALSFALDLPLIAVRKPNDHCHDSGKVNGYLGCKAYLIVDDLIATGDTVHRVINEIRRAAEVYRTTEWRGDVKWPEEGPACAAILLYNATCANHRFMDRIPVYVIGNDFEIPGDRPKDEDEDDED